ncbi:MAG TPA: TraR/DksA family transcriptional regulator [Rudaea sp.]|jgi:DnaK suppressor protein|uniref:TraR/DksA family transcriptional regulator n=1 Tax=Rudaea sp. TaxID=2136325 RepID=UPI002F955914
MSGHNTSLTREFIEQQHKRLLALRDQLLGGEHRTISRERELQQEYGGEASEFEEKAQVNARREVNQALHDVDNRRLADIERALKKIEQGTYGISDMSGKHIPQARLEATPEAVLTVQEEATTEK